MTSFSKIDRFILCQKLEFLSQLLLHPALDVEERREVEWEKRQYEDMLYFGNYDDYVKYGGSFEEVIVPDKKVDKDLASDSS